MQCSKCSKTINGNYVIALGKAWHEACFRCNHCNQIIIGEFIDGNGLPYHERCYKLHLGESCIICTKIFSNGEIYQQDFWGNKYHIYHKENYPTCFGCGRLAYRELFWGGLKFPDGRFLCKLCRQMGIDNIQDASLHQAPIDNFLKTIKFNVNLYNQRLFLVNYQDLTKTLYSENQDCSQLGCMIGFPSMKTVDKILVLKGLPLEQFLMAFVHELTHVWLLTNGINLLSKAEEEGFCNYVSYLYLSNINTTRAAYSMWIIENMSDEVYGRGFQISRNFVKKSSFEHLRMFLINNHRFPKF
jgi:hypothetical protein